VTSRPDACRARDGRGVRACWSWIVRAPEGVWGSCWPAWGAVIGAGVTGMAGLRSRCAPARAFWKRRWASVGCAAGFAGIYDMRAMYTRRDISDFIGGEAYLERAIGVDEAKLEAFSPVSHANLITVPVLLIHGAKDRRAPVYHAKQMADVLRAAKRDVTLVVDPSFGHGIFSETKRAAHYERLLDFFDKSLN